MFLTPLLIDMACQNTSSDHREACSKFLEASAKSTQVYQTDQKIEDYYTFRAKTEADTYLGNGAEKISGGLYFVYKTRKNRAVDFKLPTLGLCDSVSNHITIDSYTLNLSWKFPWLK